MMKNKSLINHLNEYLIQYPDEYIKVGKTLDFIKNHDTCFDRNNWSGHFTGSAWVVDTTRAWILMTNHIQLNMWLQLGGHAEGNPDLLSVAVKEAKEESGLKKFKIISDKIFDLDIHQIPIYGENPPHLHFDVRYLLEAEHKDHLLIASNESHEIAWVNKKEVLNKNPEDSISRMLHKMKKY
jgi:8-oxo-dGTP pyrophosphatase MutT (NUDIX family)|tara:strand:- start:994 stop:1539 length:546 start_codon:yes stop_codon:yes gene_type:complete